MLDYLHNKIDICVEPFSDIGSRLLVYKEREKNEIYIKLAERLTNIEPGLGTYLKRSPFIESIRFLDENGKELDFNHISSPYLLSFRTKLGEFKLVFQDVDTITIAFPEDTIFGISFSVNHTFKKNGSHGAEIKKIKNFAYKTTAKILNQEAKKTDTGELISLQFQSSHDDYLALKITDSSNLEIELSKFNQIATSAKERWQFVFEKLPQVVEEYQEKYAFAWWVILNNIVSPRGKLTQNTVMPSKAYYIGAWLWDCAFHAIALRHLDPKLAQDQIKLMLNHQLPDGMIPDAIYDDGVVTEINHPISARVTKPPILAWAANKVSENLLDRSFIMETYPAFSRENVWWFTKNDFNGDGLVEYAHPYSSGLDDNPLWDSGMPVESPDINTYLVIQMEALAFMAEQLGRTEEALDWKRRAGIVADKMINLMWDDNMGLFWALHDNKPIQVVTPFNLLPLWTGTLSQEMVSKVVGNLFNPELFGGELSIPSVARTDQKFDPETMWRGPIWVNINYFFIDALRRNNKNELAHELSIKTLDLINNQNGIYEYYSPETGFPPKTAAPVFSWSAAVFIDLAIQVSKDL